LNPELSRKVRERVSSRCEYRELPSPFHPAPFQIHHVMARQHGGTNEYENLALACIHCNRSKGPNIAGLDPDTGKIVRLFHPRRDKWTEHFVWDGPELKALTQIGRVTIAVLMINDPEVIAIAEGSPRGGRVRQLKTCIPARSRGRIQRPRRTRAPWTDAEVPLGRSGQVR